MVGWQPLRKVSWTEPCLGSRLAAGPRRGIWNEGKWLYRRDDCAVTSRNQGCDHRALGNLRGHGEPGWKRLYWRTWQGHNLWKCLKSKQKVLRAKVFRHFIEKAHHYLEVSRDKPFSLSLSKRSFWQKVGCKILYTKARLCRYYQLNGKRYYKKMFIDKGIKNLCLLAF